MKQLSFHFRHTAQISEEEAYTTALTIEPEIAAIKAALKQNPYVTDYASCALPYDGAMHEKVAAAVEAKKRLCPAALVVIGIGGSNLGTKAVFQALYGMYYNQQQPDCLAYFVDTFDTDASYDVYLLIEQLLQEEKNVIINIISKSGTTLETQANAALFVNLIKKYRPDDYHELIVITTDHNSVLWQAAQHEGFLCLEIPHLVGGRFSVLSPVGLFPLGMLGVALDELLAGAAQMLEQCVSTDIENNPAALSAALLDTHYFRGAVVHDTFIFSPDMSCVGDWYRQLLAESLGKTYDRAGGLVRVGMLPTVSIGSTDLHSMGQLYLAGQRNRFTTFITVDKNKSDVQVPHEESMLKGLKADFSFQQLMKACAHGTMVAYQKQELPFVHINFPEKSAWYLGQFLQMKMFEILYFGYLLDVNPFDQPQVELYKQEMRKLLS